MSMRWQVEPMPRWPYPDTAARKPNPFRAGFEDTLTLLARELDHLDVTGAVAVRVVTTDAAVRRDGMLRARAHVEHPGVIVSFTSRHGALSYPCDTYTGRYTGDPPDWQINLRAIALALEALRAVDRYGVTSRGEQYTGWRQVEAPDAEVGFSGYAAALAWLREITGDDTSAVETLLRRAARVCHPDHNEGQRSGWDRYEKARRVIHDRGPRP
jgi:hypothetical protein